jgi:RNA polymerase sigma-70 factor (ECF subfamily)
MSNRPEAAVAVQPIETQLHMLVAAGELEAAVTLMVREYGAAVLSHAVRVLGDRELAKDVYQRTFLEAHRDLRSFHGRSTFKTWLMSIANHRSLDLVRTLRREQKRTASKALLQLPDDSVVDSHASLDGPRILRALDDCLKFLSDEARSTVLLRYQQGLSYEEIASRSGVRPGTLHARVTRAMPVLRECLERKGFSL